MRYEQNNSFESNLNVIRVLEIQEDVIFVLLNLSRNISGGKKSDFLQLICTIKNDYQLLQSKVFSI